ncbi:MAG TPA: hypothetical protein VGM64_15695 [Lacunisphaera sp.]|jgi:hypothetical protein
MPEYGGYDSRRHHAQSALTSVHEAVASDGRPGRFALKIFHPPPSTDVRRLYAIEGWLIAAERQRDAAKNGGSAVVEVLACGRCVEGAFMVTPWIDHAFEPLMETISAKGDLLRAMAECLLAGLAGWEKQFGGPHGRLKPANVFLSGSGPLTSLATQFSDPWFLPRAKPEELRARDLAAIGAMLVQVVRRRSAGGWPIEEAPEWRSLGRAGSAWLAYCNYLLNPQPAAGELTIEEARRRLEKIPRDARPGRNVALLSGTVILLAAGGVVGFARFGDPKGMPLTLRKLAEATGNERAFRTEITPDWARLCRAWGSWLGDVQRNGERWDHVENFWPPADPLRTALAKFQANADKLRPQTLVSAAAGETRLGVLADAPSEKVHRQLLRGTVAESVTDAWTQVDGLAQALDKWPQWDELRKLLAMLEARGFTRAAAALRSRVPVLATTATPGSDVVATLKLFNNISQDDAGTLSLTIQWREISQLSAEMEASGDRVQQAMPRLILGHLVDRSSLGDFADSLAEPLAEMRRRRAQFLAPAVVRDRFLKESPLQSEKTAVTEADFARWEQELELSSHVPAADDPRAASEFDTRVSRLTRSAGDLEKDAPAGEATALSRAGFDALFTPLVEQLKQLRARAITRRDLPEVSRDATQLTATFQALEQRLEATLALLKPDIWLKRVGEPAGKFAASKQRWAAWQQEALTGVTSATLEQDRARFRLLRQQEHVIRDWLEGMEGPAGFGALTVPSLGGISSDAADALRQLETTRREQAASAVVTAAQWRDALPVAAWAEEGPAVRAPLEAHRKWLDDLPAFGSELDRLGTLLNGGFSLNEGVAEAAGQLARRDGVDALTGRAAGWLNEAKQLALLGNSNDRAALIAAAKDGGLSRQLTVWRRLGGLTGWPAGAEELDLDGALVGSMRTVVGRDVKDEVRRRGLLDELTKETRVRWNRAARNAAHNEGELAAVFERMDRYGIGAGDLEEPVAYNLMLWQLKHAIKGESNLGRLRSQRDGFVAKARAMPSGARPEVAAFLDKIAAVELVDDPNQKAALSPARITGWQEESPDNGLSIIASWQGPGGRSAKLVYSLVQPVDATPPFYLAQREIAVGEFIDLVGASPDGRAVLQELPQWAAGGDTLSKPWNKPIAWRPRADYKGIELNPTWIYLPDAQVKALLDNVDLRTRTPVLARVASEVPTVRSPVQQIPPDAARVFAEKLLGARLPTPQEWRTVVKLFPPGAGGDFRGRDFHEMWQFLETHSEGGQSVRWRPNEGVFLPLVAAATGGLRRPFADDGQVKPENTDRPLWLSPVDAGPSPGGFVNLVGNVWIYLYDDVGKQFYVAGGSALSPPGVGILEPLKVEATGLIGARRVTEGFSDVGIRPAFDAPPGVRERFKLLLLVQQQQFLSF